MLLLIVCAMYAAAVILLVSFMIKNYIKIRKNEKQSELYRQYFFTALIIFFILLGSFIAILSRITNAVGVTNESGGRFFIGTAEGEGYGLFKYFIVFILGVLLFYLADSLFLKKNVKTSKHPYTRRYLLVILFIVIAVAMAVVTLLF